MNVTIFGRQIHRLHSNMVIFHVAHVTPQRYTVGYDDIIFNGYPICITEVKSYLMADMHILAYFAAHTSPDSWS